MYSNGTLSNLENIELTYGEGIILREGGNTLGKQPGAYVFVNVYLNAHSTLQISGSSSAALPTTLYASQVTQEFYSSLIVFNGAILNINGNIEIGWLATIASDGNGYAAQSGPSPGLSNPSHGGTAWGMYLISS